MIILNCLNFFLVSILLSSCGYYQSDKTKLEFTGIKQQDISALSFQTIKSTILSPRCISCHQQYNNYESVIVELKSIESSIENNRMPKNSSALSTGQKTLLTEWILIGAPENPGDVTKIPLPKKIEANWNSINQNIFIPKCLVCHNPNGQANFLNLTSRQEFFKKRNELFGNDKFIDFDQPGNSYLIKITQDNEEPMPPTWSNIESLNTEEVNIILKWISLGLP